MNKQLLVRVLVIFTLVFVGVTAFNYFTQPKQNMDEFLPSYTRFIKMVNNDGVFKVRIQGNVVNVIAKTGEEFIVTAPDHDPNMINDLLHHNVDVLVLASPKRNVFFEIFINSIPILLLIGVWIYFMRKQGGGGRLGSIGNSKAKLLEKDEHNEVSFADVAGCDEAKEEMEEIIDFLTFPEKYSRLGGRVPKGVLLTGGRGAAAGRSVHLRGRARETVPRGKKKEKKEQSDYPPTEANQPTP